MSTMDVSGFAQGLKSPQDLAAEKNELKKGKYNTEMEDFKEQPPVTAGVLKQPTLAKEGPSNTNSQVLDPIVEAEAEAEKAEQTNKKKKTVKFQIDKLEETPPSSKPSSATGRDTSAKNLS